jgi:hypothetical protein
VVAVTTSVAVSCPPSMAGGTDRVIRWFSTIALLVVWSISAGASFTHIRDLAVHGQRGWVAWAVAVSMELVVGMAALEILRDSRTGHRSGVPWLVLVAGAGLVLATNVASAEPSVWGWVLAGWPAAASMAATKLLVRRLGHSAEAEDRRLSVIGATRIPWSAAGAPAPKPFELQAVPLAGERTRRPVSGSVSDVAAGAAHAPGPVSPDRVGRINRPALAVARRRADRPAGAGGQSAQPRRPGRTAETRLRAAPTGKPGSAGGPVPREKARRLYSESLQRGTPLTGAEVGAACGMGERWGRQRIGDNRDIDRHPQRH